MRVGAGEAAGRGWVWVEQRWWSRVGEAGVVEVVGVGLKLAQGGAVGGWVPGGEVDAVLEGASELLEFAPVSEGLGECYLAGDKDGARPTLALGFGRLMARIFADQGLVV